MDGFSRNPGIFAGIGGGLVFRFGGTTGGGDIIGRYVEQKKGIAIGQTLFMLDILILTLSLSYIDIQHMMYTVIASFVFSQVVAVVQNGGYTVRGMLIIDLVPASIAALAAGATCWTALFSISFAWFTALVGAGPAGVRLTPPGRLTCGIFTGGGLM